MICEIISVGRLETNCIILADEETRKGVVIDPGAEGSKILSYVEDNYIDIQYILLTHHHYDHIGAVSYIKRNLKNCPIIAVHREEARHIPDSIRYLGTMNKSNDLAFDIDKTIEDGEIISVGNIQIKAIKVPGHTIASLCYHIQKENKLIAGDTLFYHSIGVTRYYDGPSTDLVENIIKNLLVLDDNTVVYPGHGLSTTIEEEKKANDYLKIRFDS